VLKSQGCCFIARVETKGWIARATSPESENLQQFCILISRRAHRLVRISNLEIYSARISPSPRPSDYTWLSFTYVRDIDAASLRNTLLRQCVCARKAAALVLIHRDAFDRVAFLVPLAIYRYVGERQHLGYAISFARNHAGPSFGQHANRRQSEASSSGPDDEGTAWRLSRQWRRRWRERRGDGERAGERNGREGENASRVSGSVGRVTERRRVPLAPALTRLAGTVTSPMRGVAPTCRLLVILVAHVRTLLAKERETERERSYPVSVNTRGGRERGRDATAVGKFDVAPDARGHRRRNSASMCHSTLWSRCYGIYLHTLTCGTKYRGLDGWGGGGKR